MRCCSNPRPLVYRTRRTPRWTIRYRRCALCGSTSKTIQAGFVDARNWIDRDLLLDRQDSMQDVAIMSSMELFNPCEESYVDDKQFD